MTVRSAIRPAFFGRPRVRDRLSLIIALGTTLAGLYGAWSMGQPVVALLPFLLIATTFVLWRRPILSLYILFGGAILIEFYPTGFRDASTDLIPLWRNLTTSHIAPIPVTPGEILMVMGLGFWSLRNLVAQRPVFHGSPVLRHYGVFLLVVAVALAHGALTGGITRIGLWEVRAPVYALVTMALALNLIETRAQVERLGWLVILVTGLKGLQGTWRYVVTFGGSFPGETLLSHEEALFFPAFYLYLLLMFVFGAPRHQKQVAVGLLPFVILSDVANRRRASTGALVIALIAVVCILYIVLVAQRPRLLRGIVITAVVLGIYAGAFWNSSSKLAQPLSAIRSSSTPNARDASSNLYRDLETKELMVQIRANLLLGRGYGIEMPLPPGMADLRNNDPFILYMPHNSILWVWWRTGLLGFALFWSAIGGAIIYNCLLARATMDREVRRWAIFAVAVVILNMMLGYWDMGLEQPRELIYTWTILAVPEVLRRLGTTTTPTPALTAGRPQ